MATRTINREALAEMPERELRRLAAKELQIQQEITIKVDRMTLLCLISQIQLAGRHPENRGAGQQVAESLVQQIAAELPPAMAEVVRRGIWK